MSEDLLNEIIGQLEQLNSNVPITSSSVNLEGKLDKIIELLDYQNDISQRIEDRLDRIEDIMPSGSTSLSTIEGKLGDINDELSSVNTNLGYIDSNTSN
jgi:archaellum component FlaC